MYPKTAIVYHKSRAEIALDILIKKLNDLYNSAKGHNISIKYKYIQDPLCDEKCRRIAWQILLYLFDEYRFGNTIVLPKRVVESLFGNDPKPIIRLKIIDLIFGQTKLQTPKNIQRLSATEREILKYIAKYAIITTVDLAEKMNLPTETIRYYVRSLSKKKIVQLKEIRSVVLIRTIEI